MQVTFRHKNEPRSGTCMDSTYIQERVKECRRSVTPCDREVRKICNTLKCTHYVHLTLIQMIATMEFSL